MLLIVGLRKVKKMPDYHQLYSTYVKKLRIVNSSDQQYVGICPFHNDVKPSFSVNMDTGLCHCFAGCFDGNAYQFAIKVGEPDPVQYINGVTFKKPPKTEPKPELLKIIQPMTDYLLNHPEYMPSCWDAKVVKDMNVGYGNGEVQFAHHDINGNIIAIHEHRGRVMGVKESKWYMIHKVKDFDIVFVERG